MNLGGTKMRFMMLLPAPADALEKCRVPDKDLVLAMRKYNAEMAKAGVLLSAEGLHPTSKGTRLRISGGKPVITDGPFTEAKEVVAGFWIIQAASKEEAIEWAKRCPLPEHGLIEIRPVFENCDFPPDLQEKPGA
jgi:hypothetical protein